MVKAGWWMLPSPTCHIRSAVLLLSFYSMSATTRAAQNTETHTLARRIGLFDATMVVMGGIIGAGIFMNPYVVARQVHTPLLILGAWIAGGAIALLGAFIWAELAALRPDVGGQYAYLRDGFHPLFGFLYGWVLLLVIQTGGMAVVAVTFARYFLELTGWPLPDWAVAVIALALLTIINCAGIRPGAKVQSALTVLKITAIAALIAAGASWMARPHAAIGKLSTSQGRITVASTAGNQNAGVGTGLRPVPQSATGQSPTGQSPVATRSFFGTLSSFLAAMVPVLFAFGGWQTVNFIAGEVREPRRNLPRALLWGVLGVIALYVAVNFVCVYVLGAGGLAETTTPASGVMRATWGAAGARLIALGIAVSALGFLSQSILTAPRVYFAMADDGAFFRSVAHVNPRTHVPDVAIILQSVWTVVIAISGRYEQILNYVTSMDWVFFGMTALTIFVFRRRDAGVAGCTSSSLETRNLKLETGLFRTPGHPFTTAIFAIAAFAVVINTVYRYPENTLTGFAILLAGVPVYYIWRRTK
jgi:APA family basic amino acid/polyamine antiporter